MQRDRQRDGGRGRGGDVEAYREMEVEVMVEAKMLRGRQRDGGMSRGGDVER